MAESDRIINADNSLDRQTSSVLDRVIVLCDQQAEECHRLAKEMTFREHQWALRRMADAWREFALDAERRVPKTKAKRSRSKATKSKTAVDMSRTAR